MINPANVIGLNPKDWQNSAEETRVVAESMQDELQINPYTGEWHYPR